MTDPVRGILNTPGVGASEGEPLTLETLLAAMEAIKNQPPEPHRHSVGATALREFREGVRDFVVCFECGTVIRR